MKRNLPRPLCDLITDDGDFLHRVISPKRHVPKTYLTTLDRPLDGAEGEVFAAGTLMLDGEEKPLLPAQLDVVDTKTARLTITEGRYHQVRRMFAAVGNHVVTLHRERIGGLVLPDDLEPGQHRILPAAQAEALNLMRHIAANDGHAEAMTWSLNELQAFVRGTGREEFAAMLRRARSSSNRDAVNAAERLFDLQPGFRLDIQQLSVRYRELAKAVHPDRFADAPEREQRLALANTVSRLFLRSSARAPGVDTAES